MNHNKVLNNILEEWNNLVYGIDTDAAHSIDLTNSYHFVLLERAMNNLDLPSFSKEYCSDCNSVSIGFMIYFHF